MSASEPQGLDWLRVGAVVTVYETASKWGRDRSWRWSGVRQAKVERVTATGFRVEGERALFVKASLRGQGEQRHRHVAVPGSALDLEVMDELYRRRAHDRATAAVEAWLKEPTPETRAAALEALTGWRGLKP